MSASRPHSRRVAAGRRPDPDAGPTRRLPIARTWFDLRIAVVGAVTRFPGTAMAISLFSVMVAWSLMLPLFAGPDETTSYVKAAAVVRLELVGDDDVPPSIQDSYFRTAVDIDRQFGAANWIPWCFVPMPEAPACDRPLEDTDPVDDRPWTNMGRYPPLGFVVPGLATFLGPNDLSVRIARVLNALVCAAFLGAAYGRLRRDTSSSIVLLVAVTPGVLFLGGVVNTSGPEICAALASWVFVPRALDGSLISRGDRVVLALACVALVGARPLGVLILPVIVAVSMVAGPGIGGLRGAIVHLPVVTAASVVTALAMVGWYLRVSAVHLDELVTEGLPSIGLERVVLTSLGRVPRLVEQIVGNFGWLDTPAPTAAVWATLAMAGAVVLGGWSAMSNRERFALALVAGATVALSVYVDADFYRILRTFGVQGRHLAPLLLGIPILAGRRWRPSAMAERVLALTWCAVVLICAGAALRRYSVGVRDANVFDMFRSPAWTPPLGIVATLLLMAVACSFVAVVALTPDANARRDVEATPILTS